MYRVHSLFPSLANTQENLSRRRTCAAYGGPVNVGTHRYTRLALYRSGRQPLDDFLVERHVEDQCGNDRYADRGECRPPIDRAVLSGEVQQTRRNGAIAVTTDEGQCERQLIPEEKELNQGNGHEPVRDHGQRHTVEDLVDACSVESRRLDHRAWDG